MRKLDNDLLNWAEDAGVTIDKLQDEQIRHFARIPTPGGSEYLRAEIQAGRLDAIRDYDLGAARRIRGVPLREVNYGKRLDVSQQYGIFAKKMKREAALFEDDIGIVLPRYIERLRRAVEASQTVVNTMAGLSKANLVRTFAKSKFYRHNKATGAWDVVDKDAAGDRKSVV